ncbi:MAG: FAD-dependent oxidoreductase [Candidatus Thermoplasmatota archaeon]|nr:FAD-dependent oxidoreductase [Candidatus Thermoplasmatota archaeon]MBS3790251.1 FAD-dependent oxidoreductase [Candidatus Thermoplasmatota archaeon]
MYDVLIVGTGPAGYTAAIYSARYNLDTIQIGEMPGGLISEAPEVCNYPGFESISGMELSNKMEEQTKELGVEVVYDEVIEIKGEDLDFKVKAKRDEYEAKKIILATGQERRRLGLDRENEFKGKGVSYCATCDAAFYDDKVVGVVGGGDAALASALLLSDHAEKVYILYRRDEFFRPEPIRVKEIEQRENIESVFEVNVENLVGEEKLEAVELDNSEKLEMDGLFIEIGSIPNSDLAEDLGINLTEEDYIITDEERRTNIPGVYGAGDVIDSPLKQGITAAGQGAEAASTAYEELKKEEVE